MIQNVFIIGATGKVGKELFYQLSGNWVCPENYDVRIVGLRSSKTSTYNSGGVSHKQISEFYVHKSGKKLGLDEIVEEFKEMENLVFVDCTNDKKEMKDFHLNVIKHTSHGIVSANKNPLVFSRYNEFEELTRDPGRYRYSSSVMAGAGAVDKIRELRDLGDGVLRIEGCFSGTLQYICSELRKGEVFSDIVSDAERKGYTETDPRDDLSGEDVAKKLVILARTAGIKSNYRDVKIEPFIPKTILKVSDDRKFWNGLEQLDEGFKEKAKLGKEIKSAWAYIGKVCIGRIPSLKVELMLLPNEGSFGNIKGKNNKIVITTGKYNFSTGEYSIEAPGAGLDITSLNIRGDLLKMAKTKM